MCVSVSRVCVCAGKGPQKEHYRKLIDSLHLEHVNICTPWLEAEDYPVLLGETEEHELPVFKLNSLIDSFYLEQMRI